MCVFLGCSQCSPQWEVCEGKQPGFTGVFSRVEIHNMVISLENRIRIIDWNNVRIYFALVDILPSSQLSDLRRTFEIQALVINGGTTTKGIENVLCNPFFLSFLVLLSWYFLSAALIKNPLAVFQKDNSSFVVAPTVIELLLLREANCVVLAPLSLLLYLMYKPWQAHCFTKFCSVATQIYFLFLLQIE